MRELANPKFAETTQLILWGIGDLSRWTRLESFSAGSMNSCRL